MGIKNYYDENYTYLDRNGNALTEDEIKFLNLIKNIEEMYGASVLLAFRVIMEATIKGPNNTRKH